MIENIPINLEVVDGIVYLTVDRIGHPMPLDEFMAVVKNGVTDGRVLLYNAAINAGLSGAKTPDDVLTLLKGKALKG